MKERNYMAVAERAMDIIKKGAFLTVRNGDQLNTMAIGWAAFGFMWRKPILMVMVRKTRHTFRLIEKSNDFTVSVPTSDMHDQVMFCGTQSGRDVDKFESLEISTKDSRKVNSPILDITGIHFECRVTYRSAMDPSFLDTDTHQEIYPKKDYHTLYFGEIVSCYETE